MIKIQIGDQLPTPFHTRGPRTEKDGFRLQTMNNYIPGLVKRYRKEGDLGNLLYLICIYSKVGDEFPIHGTVFALKPESFDRQGFKVFDLAI